MPFRWRDSFGIAWTSPPARMYVEVTGAASIAVTAGVLRFTTTGGVVDRVVNGSDYDLGDSYVQAKVTAFGSGSILRLRLRSNGTNYAEATVNLTTGAWTLGNQAGGGAGSGTIDAPPAVNDTFRLECIGGTSPTVTLFHQPGSSGSFINEGSGTTSTAATGRAGCGITAVAGDLDDLDLGPIPLPARKAAFGGGSVTTRCVALATTFGGTGDAQAACTNGIWNSGWAVGLGPHLDDVLARRYRRLCQLRLGENSTGITFAAEIGGGAFTAVPLSPRLYDALLAGTGFATPPADGRLLDNFQTFWKPYVDAFDEVIAYFTPPPNGIGAGSTAWPDSDVAREEFVQEFRQLGMTLAFDVWSGVDPGEANSDRCRKFFDYLLRTKLPGERLYGEAHLQASAQRNPFVVPPHLSSTFKVGPQEGWMSLDDTDSDIFEQTLRDQHIWWGPGRLGNGEHVSILSGSISVATRYDRAVKRLLQGHTVVVEISGFTPAQDAELQRLGRLPAYTGRGRGRRGSRT